MIRNACLAVCVLCAFFLAAPLGAVAADEATQVVEKLHGVLLANMKGSPTLTYDERFARLAPVVHETFDLPAMTRVSIGAAWRNMSEQERADVTDAFADWTIANYAAQFDGFDGEAFAVTDEADAGRGNMMVNTELRAKDETVALNYRLRQTSGTWRIIDIYLDGAVSQLAVRRGEFAAVLGKGTVGQLIDHMRTLTAKLAADG